MAGGYHLERVFLGGERNGIVSVRGGASGGELLTPGPVLSRLVGHLPWGLPQRPLSTFPPTCQLCLGMQPFSANPTRDWVGDVTLSCESGEGRAAFCMEVPPPPPALEASRRPLKGREDPAPVLGCVLRQSSRRPTCCLWSQETVLSLCPSLLGS